MSHIIQRDLPNLSTRRISIFDHSNETNPEYSLSSERSPKSSENCFKNVNISDNNSQRNDLHLKSSFKDELDNAFCADNFQIDPSSNSNKRNEDIPENLFTSRNYAVQSTEHGNISSIIEGVGTNATSNVKPVSNISNYRVNPTLKHENFVPSGKIYPIHRSNTSHCLGQKENSTEDPVQRKPLSSGGIDLNKTVCNGSSSVYGESYLRSRKASADRNIRNLSNRSPHSINSQYTNGVVQNAEELIIPLQQMRLNENNTNYFNRKLLSHSQPVTMSDNNLQELKRHLGSDSDSRLSERRRTKSTSLNTSNSGYIHTGHDYNASSNSRILRRPSVSSPLTNALDIFSNNLTRKGTPKAKADFTSRDREINTDLLIQRAINKIRGISPSTNFSGSSSEHHSGKGVSNILPTNLGISNNMGRRSELTNNRTAISNSSKLKTENGLYLRQSLVSSVNKLTPMFSDGASEKIVSTADYSPHALDVMPGNSNKTNISDDTFTMNNVGKDDSSNPIMAFNGVRKSSVSDIGNRMNVLGEIANSEKSGSSVKNNDNSSDIVNTIPSNLLPKTESHPSIRSSLSPVNTAKNDFAVKHGRRNVSLTNGVLIPSNRRPNNVGNALLEAVRNGRVRHVQLLLAAGMDPNRKDENGDY